MTQFAINALALLGAAFMFVAAVGIVRLPKVLWRMHAAAKAGTLGAGLLLASVAIASSASAASRAAAAALFIVLTAPVATHVMAQRVAGVKGRLTPKAPSPNGDRS